MVISLGEMNIVGLGIRQMLDTNVMIGRVYPTLKGNGALEDDSVHGGLLLTLGCIFRPI